MQGLYPYADYLLDATVFERQENDEALQILQGRKVMSAKLTESQLAERRKIVADALERNPALTVHHFHVAYGYNTLWLKSLGLKFGKHKPDPFKFASTAKR